MDTGRIAELSTLVNSSLDIDEVLVRAMRYVETLMDAEVSSIFEVDPDSGELFFRVAKSVPGGAAKTIRLTRGEGIAGAVAISGEPLVVPDATADSRFSGRVDAITGFQTRSLAAVPICNRGRVAGVLEVINKRGATFAGADVDALTIVANQIGVAMENAKLYARLAEKFELTRVELRKTQEQLLRAERLAALGQFARGVAHELRNPAMVIGGFARRARKLLTADEAAATCIDAIIGEAFRVEAIVADVERFTSLPEPRPEALPLSPFLRDVFQGFPHEKAEGEIGVSVSVEPEGLVARADRALLRLALLELFRNAQEAFRGPGEIQVSARNDPSGIFLSVRDNGVGIKPEDLPSVFDPFFTSKMQGSGLGLTTVHRIITGHEGTVAISSQLGFGTEVQIRLP